MAPQPWSLVTVDEAKLFARYRDSDEDVLFVQMINAASLAAENHTGRQFIIRKRVEEHIGDGKYVIRTDRRPIVSVEKVEIDGRWVDPGTYQVIGSMGRIRSYFAWRTGSVIRVEYAAGHVETLEQAQAEIPDVIQGVLICVARWFENREALQSESVQGIGSKAWIPPREAFTEWDRYRVRVGV